MTWKQMAYVYMFQRVWLGLLESHLHQLRFQLFPCFQSTYTSAINKTCKFTSQP